MSRNRDIERNIEGVRERAAEHVRRYADEASDRAGDLVERGRRAGRRLIGRRRDYSQQLVHYAEDVADEANYQYRRLKRQVRRHPTATVAIVAGTVGAFLLLRHLFRDRDDD
jgi:hypothetical protein